MRLLLALVVIASLAACDERVPKPKVETTQTMGAAAQPSPEVQDTHIVTSIRQALAADRELGQFMIDVDSKEGLVVLSGVAPSEAARERATQIARGTPHVHDIENQLVVRQG
jgi:hyperosmotically inducible periplasmic protein